MEEQIYLFEGKQFVSREVYKITEGDVFYSGLVTFHRDEKGNVSSVLALEPGDTLVQEAAGGDTVRMACDLHPKRIARFIARLSEALTRREELYEPGPFFEIRRID